MKLNSNKVVSAIGFVIIVLISWAYLKDDILKSTQTVNVMTNTPVATNVVAKSTNMVVTNADGTITVEHGFRFGFSKPE
jgi:hypothetical protein